MDGMPEKPCTLLAMAAVCFASTLFVSAYHTRGAHTPIESLYLKYDVAVLADKSTHPHLAAMGESFRALSCKRDRGYGFPRGTDAFQVQCHHPSYRNRTHAAGKGWGEHMVVRDLLPAKGKGDCIVVSYGLSNDVTFEEEMSKKHGCRGLAMDPTIPGAPPGLSGTSFEYRKVGAPLLDGLQHRDSESLVATRFPTLSPVLAAKELHGGALDGKVLSLLKMDCEGCEYAIASLVAAEMPTFFSSVKQLAIEIHVSATFMSTEKHLQALEQLMGMLSSAGLKLVHAQFGGCGAELKLSWWQRMQDENVGRYSYTCLPGVETAGWPCRLTCQNLLFARV